MGDPRNETPSNLPASLTSFVGRQREIVEVARLLGECRLLTLTGEGGCGKSRLALETARVVLNQFVDGAWIVELAALSDVALVPQAVAKALDVPEQPGIPIAAAWAEGTAMLPERAIEYALAAGPSRQRTVAEPPAKQAIQPGDAHAGRLTAREREVAALVAQGLTNRDIAARLVIAERTAEGHVQNILNKLGTNSRAQIAAWAVAQGLSTGLPGSPPYGAPS